VNAISREQMNELIQVEEQLKSKKKRMETMESLISNREQQIDTLREMNKSLQEEKDMVFYFIKFYEVDNNFLFRRNLLSLESS
jgi:hypothetical protein